MKINKEILSEFARFCLVGLLATAVHYGVYLLLNLCCQYNIAYTAGYVVSLAMNFYLSSRFTFKKTMSVWKGGGFLLSHLVNYVLHILLLNLFIWLGLSETWAPVPVFAIVVPVNFILVRTVFKKFK